MGSFLINIFLFGESVIEGINSKFAFKGAKANLVREVKLEVVFFGVPHEGE